METFNYFNYNLQLLFVKHKATPYPKMIVYLVTIFHNNCLCKEAIVCYGVGCRCVCGAGKGTVLDSESHSTQT